MEKRTEGSVEGLSTSCGSEAEKYEPIASRSPPGFCSSVACTGAGLASWLGRFGFCVIALTLIAPRGASGVSG